MLSDLAPLEMSAPEPADARLSGVGSVQTPLRLVQLLPVRSRTTDTLNETRQAAETKPGPDAALSSHSPAFLPHVLRLHLILEKCICYRPAAAAYETDLCCLTARCAGGTKGPCVKMMWAKAKTGACLNDP